MKRGEISHIKEVNKPCSVLLKGSSCSMEADWSHCIYFVALCCYPEQRTLDQDVAWAKDLNCSFFVCIKGLSSPRNSTISMPPFQNVVCLLPPCTKLDLCLFLFNKFKWSRPFPTPTPLSLSLKASARHCALKIQSVTNWKKCKRKKHISISIHMASHLLNDKLAEKFSFHRCIHSQKQPPVFLCCLYTLG